MNVRDRPTQLAGLSDPRDFEAAARRDGQELVTGFAVERACWTKVQARTTSEVDLVADGPCPAP